MSWTDERVEKLKELWVEGKSASQIARELGGVSRNAVIGKVHRLGLSNRSAGGAEEAKASPAPKPAEAVAAPVPPAPEAAAPAAENVAVEAEEDAAPEQEAEAASPPAMRRHAPAIRDASQPRAPGPPTPEEEAARRTLVEIEKIAKRISLLELTERVCKWPIGDPDQEGFAFCGLPSVPGKPYCKHHIAIAFQPMSSRRDRIRVPR